MPQLPESIEQQIRPQKTGSCHLWYGKSSKLGYPLIVHDKQNFGARRLIYEIMTEKKIPNGVSLKMTCGNVMCVNAEHMRQKN